MKYIVSYKCSLKKMPIFSTRDLKNTIAIYRDAVEFIAEATLAEWNIVSPCGSLKEKEHCVETFIHETKSNPTPKYNLFDKKFYKFPSYLRRSAIDEAIGTVSSYVSNLKNYKQERYAAISAGQKFKKKAPTMNFKTNKFPTLFKGNMFLVGENRNEYQIKIYKHKDWVWLPVQLRNQDLKYIEMNCKAKGFKELSPSLCFENGKYKLSFVFETKSKLPKEKEVVDRKVLAIDLGVNTLATCSVVDGKGTILARKFLNLAKEKDRMHHLLNRIGRRQRESGKKAKQIKLWTKVNGYKKEITNKIAHLIVEYAIAQQVDTIVLENLSKSMGRSRSAKIHHWNKRTIIQKVKALAHRNGIRYALVNPRNTSALAFDGSGKVIRDEDNYSLCTFTTGKRYNADLSASYNIAARYFVRAYSKSTSEKSWLDCQAKVPDLTKRTNITLASLRRLLEVLC